MTSITLATTVLLTVITVSVKGWVPIFLAFSGNGRTVFNAWRNEIETVPIPINLTNAGRLNHLRNPLIDSWRKHNIMKIKLELYSKECMVAWLIFDGKGSTDRNWFNRDRLLDSSFDDIKENKEFEFFTIRPEEQTNATFVIQKEYEDCTNDFGWFTVLDSGGPCEWTNHLSYPKIIYTRNQTPRNWNTDAKQADHMVVYVLF